jgi:hypothetical protein
LLHAHRWRAAPRRPRLARARALLTTPPEARLLWR